MKIAYFVYQYPTLTQTFIQREIEGLIKQGLELEIFPVFCPPSIIGKSTLPKGHRVNYGSVWDAILFPFRFVQEFSRNPDLLWQGFYLFLKRKLIGKDAWAHSIFGFICAINRVSYIRKNGFTLAHG
ncbi:MAG: hypothetical protein AAF984_07470, partial [Verrucomicrobiota bacterium]